MSAKTKLSLKGITAQDISASVIVIIGAVVIVGGVILYAVISTATGLEEDENQNYIPDWIERKFPKIFKGSKDLQDK